MAAAAKIYKYGGPEAFVFEESATNKVPAPKTQFLSQATKAHHDLESRATSGSVVPPPD
jgi:hypothetical protein